MCPTRISKPMNAASDQEYGLMQIDSYEMAEVRLPSNDNTLRTGIRVVLRGRNFKAVAQPLMVFVGKTPLAYVRIAPDERSVEGVLLEKPEPGAVIEARLGDQDAVQHVQPVDDSLIIRLK